MALLYIGIFLGTQVMFTIIAGILDEDPQNYMGFISVMTYVVSIGIYGVIFYLNDDRLERHLKIKKPVLVDVALSLSLAMGFRMITSVYIELSRNVNVLSESIENSQIDFNMNTMTPLGLLLIIFSIYIGAPVFEEILFRGLVQKSLGQVLPMGIVIILQGILFGVAHMALTQSLFAIVYGIILGLIYHKTRNLTITILAHSIFNISGGFEVKNSNLILQIAVVGAVMTIASIYLFLYVYRKKPAPVTGEDLGGNFDE